MRNPFEVYTSIMGEKRKRPLDWEESAADIQSRVEDIYDDDRSAPKLKLLKGAVALVFLLITARMFYLQVIHGKDFRVLSENNRIRRQTILSPRGKILDRNGQVLAQNTASFNLVATPFDLPKDGLVQEVHELSLDFGLDEGEALKKIQSTSRNSIQPLLIKQDLSLEQSILFETKASKFVGFFMQRMPIREYLDPTMYSHIIGYTGLVSPGDLDGKDNTQYDTVDYIGKLGVEKQYENFLHGKNGEDLIEVDATGKLIDVLGENSPTPGNTLVLNIDSGLQKELFDGLAQRRGAAIALNPKNGQVLALVSSPGFNNNLFAHGIKIGEYQGLLSDKNQPLFNRAISGTYPPGSTTKMMTATAGLQEGVINQDTVIVDRGKITVPNQYGGQGYDFNGWKPEGLGPMTVRSAIAQSSDIFFYEVAGGAPNGSWPGLGAQKLADYFRKFGLGKPTGIDLQGEKSGLVPDPEWKMKYFNNNPLQGKWYLGDTYHIGIGQGDLLVTPLQVAMWTAIIANGGTGYAPQVGSKAMSQDGKVLWENKPQVLVSNIASNENIKIVQEGMRQTVLSGTAKTLQALPITSAGKTGTSQFDGSNLARTHAWFTAYAPFEDPQIVVTVLVEAGGEGHAAALPIAKQALEWWAENRYNK